MPRMDVPNTKNSLIPPGTPPTPGKGNGNNDGNSCGVFIPSRRPTAADKMFGYNPPSTELELVGGGIRDRAETCCQNCGQQQQQRHQSMDEADGNEDDDDILLAACPKQRELTPTAVWKSIMNEIRDDLLPEYNDNVKSLMQENGHPEDEAKTLAYGEILPIVQKMMRQSLAEKIIFMHRLYQDPIFQKIKQTIDHLLIQGYGHEEAIYTAVDLRKLLLNKLTENKHDTEGGGENEEHL